MKLKYLLPLCILLISTGCKTGGVKILDDGTRIYTSEKDKRLEKEQVIEGYVYDRKTKKPIKNAKIEIKNINLGMGYYLVYTDESGYYKIKDFITKVKYSMEVDASTYVPYKSSGDIYPGKYEIYLDKESIIKGKVIDSKGKGIADTEITLNSGYYYNRYNTNRPIILKSDKNGNYEIKKLKSNSYFLTFRKGNYITETAGIKRIKTGETFKLEMMLYKPASISGTIKIKSLNSPAMNISVIAEGKYNHSVMTYNDGSFQLNDLKPGKYFIKLYHQGFTSFKSKKIVIKEGTHIANKNYFVEPKKPELNIYTYRYTFVPGNQISFNLRTFRLEKIKATIYKVPLNTFLKGKTLPDYLNIKKENFKMLTSWDEPIHNFKPYEWKYQVLNIKDPLPTGGYCIEIKGADKLISRKFFTVTSTGIVVKRSQYSVFAYVTNLITNKPIENASVVLFDSTPKNKNYRNRTSPYKPPKRIEDLPVDIIKKGKTDSNGIFKFNLKTKKHLSALVIGNDNSYALCSTGSPQTFEREKNKYFVYTDRPVYRSGDTVCYKIIGKSRENKFIPIKGKKLFYKIRNLDRGNTVKEGSLLLDDWGTSNGKIKIRSVSGLGEFQIQVGPGKNNLYAHGRFYVEQYRKPEFNVEITPSKEYFINGDTAEFRVTGKYFFGAPLKGAIVRYRFYESKLRDSDTRYWWEDESSSNRSYNRIKLEGDKFLDNNGVTALRLDTGNFPYDRQITVEVTVIDKTNISITSQKIVKVGRGTFYIKLNPAKNFFADNEKKEIIVKSLTHTGKPYSTKIDFNLFRYIWKPYQRVYVHDKRPVFKASVRTDASGTGKIILPEKFSNYGEFDLIADSRDNRGNNISASRIIWIYSKHGGPIASKLKNLELSVDQDSFTKSGTLNCLVKSRFTDTYVCLTLEGKDVYYSKVIKLTGNITPVSIPVKTEYAPNFYLTATMQRKRALITYTKNISIPEKGTLLKILISSDKEKYLPGDKASITVKTVDEFGKPIKADLSLAAVDESIYYIRPDHTPAMKDYFYTKISNWVLTNYSYPINILAGASKEDKIKIRSNFKDTAFWSANVKTNSNGLAKVAFELPDNLTTWRITSRGHDQKGRVGENKKKFLVTQELISRLGKPRFFVEGDNISIIGIVNSNTTRGLPDIKTKMIINKKITVPDKTVKISLPPYGSAKNYYSFRVPEKTDKINLQYESRADKNAKDALELKIPVEKRGANYNLYGIGDMGSNRTVTLKPLKDQKDFEFVPESIKISLNPSYLIQLLKSTNFLIEYPYGCVEQTTNKFLPLVALSKLLKDKNANYLLAEKKQKMIPVMVKNGIERLTRMQNGDGTWGWWHGDRGNEFVTAYVLYAFYHCKESNYTVSQSSINSGLKAVKRILNKNNANSNIDAKAFLLYVSSLWGRWNENAFNDLYNVKEKSTYTMAYLLKALGTFDIDNHIKKSYPDLLLKGNEDKKNKLIIKFKKLKTDGIKKFQTDIKQLLKKDKDGVYWASSGYQSWGWQGASIEMSSHVLGALVESGDRSTLPAQIVRSISRRNQGDSWITTKQTASVIMSFCKFLEKNNVELGKKVKVKFSMDNKVLAEINYDPTTVSDTDDLIKKIKLNNFDTKKSIKIIAEGSGSSDVTFDINAKGTLYFKPSGLLSVFKSEKNSLEALTNGIQVHRTYSGLKRVKDMNNIEYTVPQTMTGNEEIKIGDELMVKLRFTAQDNFEYLVLEDYLPSGYEVVKEYAYDIYKPFVHSERWDNRMVFFFNNLQKGELYEIAYIIRAELPGNFFVKPAKIECMYEPSIQGWASPLEISTKKNSDK